MANQTISNTTHNHDDAAVSGLLSGLQITGIVVPTHVRGIRIPAKPR
jgi:hypothetical protein